MADRIAQVGVQIALKPDPDLIIAQVGVQILLSTIQELRIRQVGVQVLLDRGAYDTPVQRQYVIVI